MFGKKIQGDKIEVSISSKSADKKLSEEDLDLRAKEIAEMIEAENLEAEFSEQDFEGGEGEGTDGVQTASPRLPARKDNKDYSQSVKTDYSREKILNLRVSADPQDISAEERKFRVKKLAGAISHSLRTSGEINVRCFGRDAISKGAKALAIARDYLKATHKHLQLNFSPAFIQTKIGGNTLTGVSFCTFTFTNEPSDRQVDIENVEIKLFVKADSKDTDDEIRRYNVRKLAGAITHAVAENGECVVRCFGKDSITKASKAIAIARGFVATKGSDLYCWDTFIVASMDGKERTGICFYCFCNS